MTVRDIFINEYFDWMFDLVCNGRYSGRMSFRKLLIQLHDTEFTYFIPGDKNRAHDGIDLRRRFALVHDYEVETVDEYLDGPCSVLEMMIALAIRCEESITDNPTKGDRTGQWFWTMINSLGLGAMMDNRYDKREVSRKLTRFLNREYAPDGRGGLFTIENSDRDLRTVEIWYQLNWYLDSIAW